jgi:two-component system response regulator AtoC
MKTRGRVLVVEDEPYVRESLLAILTSRGFDVTCVASVAQAEVSLSTSSADVVLSDLQLAESNGLDLVRRLQKDTPELPIVILTGHGTVPSAVACLRAGASDYILKPADPEALEVALDRALDARALKREVRYLRDATAGSARPLGESLLWNKTLDKVDAAARSDATVLLLGESGTGKELLARRVHERSGRWKRPFVRVNCAAVPFDTWESEFFGHRKGAFTGATADREGRFLIAHRGTLLLDEIGAVPPPVQAKFLRVIQEGEFERLGEGRPTQVDVRIVASTNADLGAEVSAGRFREDLFYRLNVIRIDVPPLRERMSDIPILAGAFARETAAQLGLAPPELSEETLGRLTAYSWPGNVRELRSVIERALVLDPGHGLDAIEILPVPSLGAEGVEADSDLTLRSVLARREREVLVEALTRTQGVRKDAAQLLGIDARNLSYYLKKHGLDAAAD